MLVLSNGVLHDVLWIFFNKHASEVVLWEYLSLLEIGEVRELTWLCCG